jgi:hypothetical protein
MFVSALQQISTALVDPASSSHMYRRCPTSRLVKGTRQTRSGACVAEAQQDI